MWDVVVVGCGPAGSRYARRASEAGHDVLALEQGTVGKPLACSGHVSTDVWDYTPDGAREELLQNEVRGARFHLGGPDSRAYPFYRDGVVSNVIDRVGLDRTLAEAARDAGADLREDHTVVGVDDPGPADSIYSDTAADSPDVDTASDSTDSDTALVRVRAPDGDVETHRTRLVAGADGPQSRVRSAVGLPEPDEFLHGVLGFDRDPDHADFVDVHLDVPGFFAWRIPRGEAGVEYGLAAEPGYDVGERFEDLLAAYNVAVEHRCSGLIPVGPPDAVTSGRTFLLGDAAGQTKPFTGGGILYGMTAADHAARTIDPTNAATLADYEDAWRADLGRDVRLGHLVRWGYDAPRVLQRVGLRLFQGEIGVHMDRPSTLFSRKQLRALLPL